jgi:hypothetical protein
MALEACCIAAPDQRGGARQERQAEQALARIEHISLETLPASAAAEARESCEEALALDAACAEAWFVLGWLLLAESADLTDEVRGCWLAAATLHRNLINPWVNAGASTRHDDEERMLDVFYAGYRLAGAEFARDMRESIRSGDAFRHDSARFAGLLEQAVTAVDQRNQHVGFTMRWVNEDGTINELVFSDSPHEAAGTPPRSTPARRPASFETRTRRKRPANNRKRRKRKR